MLRLRSACQHPVTASVMLNGVKDLAVSTPFDGCASLEIFRFAQDDNVGSVRFAVTRSRVLLTMCMCEIPI